MKLGHHKLYIGGELREASGGLIHEVICPGDASTAATIAWAGKQDAIDALHAAKIGFDFWSAQPISVRVDWMDKLREAILSRSELLRTSIMHELGKVWSATEEDLQSLTDSLQYYASEISEKENLTIEDKEGTHAHQVLFQPLGVVVAFLAYNFPLLNLGFKLGPALASGCSIIIKPSEYSPLSAYLIAEICAEINFPKGVINILCGETAEVGIPLCESQIPQLITMIGSTSTAQKLIAQSSRTSLKRYSLECGGNAPFIVFEDADLSLSVDIAAALKIGNSGQICVAPNRFYVQASIIETFIDQLVKKFEAVKVGFGADEEPDMGPLANSQSVERMQRVVDAAVSQGGQVVTGGQAINRSGYYFMPTVISMGDNNAEILQEEIFGPIAIIVPFTDRLEVLKLANDTDAGLASYVFTRDEDHLRFFAENLDFGEVQLNGVKYDIYLPHGGIKNSGIGVDCSPFALDDYLIKKRVSRLITT